MIVNNAKPFDQAIHDSSDLVSKNAIIKMLHTKGFDAMENPNKYGVDIMVGQYEVEQRTI